MQADVLARFYRQRGGDVFFLSGTDDNALKNAQAAEAAHKAVVEFVDEHAGSFKKLLAVLNVSNDDFIRTSRDDRHIKGAQKLWAACKKEDIYKKKYKGLYCLGCEEFKTDKDLVGGEVPNTQVKMETVEEEIIFKAVSEKIGKDFDIREIRIIPESRKNEMLSFVREGLEDFIFSFQERAKGTELPCPEMTRNNVCVV